ncbi:MAG: RluA family pseudouridine synthase [Alphaproteobacteria bacterium]|nr:RluA family pseudouridine synthase [Alphaproteobacteria bacterium]
MSGVRVIEVGEADRDVRLDRWFRRHFPDLGHARLEKLIRTGQVRVDGGRAKASFRLEVGMKVRVPPLGEDAEARRSAPPPRLDPDAVDWMRSLVLHIDADVIVLDKPPGIAVQGGSKVARHLDGLLDALQYDAPERPRLVHRLDRDTSGVLLLGRSATAAALLAEAFRGRAAEKTYWALVAGVPKEPAGRIDLALAKRLIGGEEKVVVDHAGGKRAITLYRVMERAGRRAAWLALRPLTGRTHQLRVHAAAIGTPIIGDRKYGDAKAFPAGIGDPDMLMLHARAIRLPQLRRGTLAVTAPLPPAMAEAWRFLGFDPGLDGDPFAGLDD